MYGVTRDGRLYRLTFSRSLAEYVARVAGCSVEPFRLVVGPELPPGGRAETGLYAVVKAGSGWPLRVTMFQPLADLWRHPSRRVHAAKVERLNSN